MTYKEGEEVTVTLQKTHSIGLDRRHPASPAARNRFHRSHSVTHTPDAMLGAHKVDQQQYQELLLGGIIYSISEVKLFILKSF